MPVPVVALLLVVVASASFFIGRSRAPEAAPIAPVTAGSTTPTSTAAAGVVTPSARPDATSSPAGRDAPRQSDGGEAPGSPVGQAPAVAAGGAAVAATRSPGAPCEVRLEEAEGELTALRRRQEELEGKPIPARDDVAPRFASAGLLSTFQRGFAQSGVKGQVESVDCSEHPCILFGRLEGDEAEVAKLEDSAVFAAYDDDIGVMLTWASGHGGHDDDDHDDKPAAGREKPAEVSLFAFAFYGVDEEARSEQIDRRIRTRTAEYWNAARPRE